MANPNGRKGSAFERLIADYWRDNWSPFIDRRVRTGAKDKGDLANVRVRGIDPTQEKGLVAPRQMSHRVVVEAKNTTRVSLSAWVAEAQEEARNDEALVGIVVAKRKGKAAPEDQFVIMTQGDFMKLLQTVTTP